MMTQSDNLTSIHPSQTNGLRNPTDCSMHEVARWPLRLKTLKDGV